MSRWCFTSRKKVGDSKIGSFQKCKVYCPPSSSDVAVPPGNFIEEQEVIEETERYALSGYTIIPRPNLNRLLPLYKVYWCHLTRCLEDRC